MSDCLDTWMSGDYLSGRLIVWRSDVCVPDFPDVWAAWMSGCLGVWPSRYLALRRLACLDVCLRGPLNV